VTQNKINNRIVMKEQIGLLDSVAMIVGIIIGSGIFVSPKGVLVASGSVGLSLVVWVCSGLLSMMGALCYAELGTAIPKSGGDYAYLWAGFGPFPAFLFLWIALLVICPSANAIIALTFASYILQAFFPSCKPPLFAVQLLAAACIALLTYINCRNVRWATRIQDVFTGTKVAALLIITGAGIWELTSAPSNHLITKRGLSGLFENTNWDPGSISVAFYQGMFSYAGWNYLNFVVEEVKSPYK
jgi:amino acid transporter